MATSMTKRLCSLMQEELKKKKIPVQTIKFTIKIKRNGENLNNDISLKIQYRCYLEKDINYIVPKKTFKGKEMIVN